MMWKALREFGFTIILVFLKYYSSASWKIKIYAIATELIFLLYLFHNKLYHQFAEVP